MSQTLTLQPDPTAGIDTVTIENTADTNYGTNAAIGCASNAGSRRFSLLKFDLSSLVGATIISATLYLYNVTVVALNRDFSVHALLAANSGWTEGATWNHLDGASAHWAGDTGGDHGTDAGCSVSGTDWNAASMGTFTYTSSNPADTEHACVLNVTQFAAMVAANYGLLVRTTTASVSSFSFRSSDYTTDITKRPKLVVVYTAAQQYAQPVTGALTPTGLLHRQGRKPLAGGLASQGYAAKRTGRRVTGAVSSTGAAKRQTSRRVTGAISSAGVARRQTSRRVAGLVVPAGRVWRNTRRVLAGGLAPAGALSRRLARRLTGSLAPAGSLGRLRAKLLAGTVSLAGSLTRRLSRVLTGLLNLAGALWRSAKVPIVTVSLTDAAATALTLGDTSATGLVLTDSAATRLTQTKTPGES